MLSERPIFSELYNVNSNVFIKQWLLTPELIKIRILYNLFVLVQNTIGSLGRYILDTFFLIFSFTLYSIYLLKLKEDVTSGIRLGKGDSSLSILM